MTDPRASARAKSGDHRLKADMVPQKCNRWYLQLWASVA
jgi:hypothetical protein